jgi:hypothetical protein
LNVGHEEKSDRKQMEEKKKERERRKRRKFTDEMRQTSEQFLILFIVQMEKVFSEIKKIGNAALNIYNS